MKADIYDQLLPFAGLLRAYHRHEVHGIENIPQNGPVLLAVNHSLATYDIVLLLAAIYQLRKRVTCPLIDRAFYKFPGLGQLMEQLGANQGSPDTARGLLGDGQLVCVAPGGMRESLRPSTERYQILWDERVGFVKVAMLAQAPIVLAACPRADDIYDVYPSRLTNWVYSNLKLPLMIARGLGPTPIPRPIKLHTIS